MCMRRDLDGDGDRVQGKTCPKLAKSQGHWERPCRMPPSNALVLVQPFIAGSYMLSAVNSVDIPP